jgi:endonuclease YncB( thermonuclease family)
MKYNLKTSFLAAFILAGNIAAGIGSTQFSSAGPQEPDAVLTGRARVYDGDSIFFGAVEVRLDAIDAPERDQACRDKAGKFWPCGIAARNALLGIVGSAQVRCVLSGKDKYRRLLGICYVHGRDLNAAMVESGNAIAYHYFSEKYASQESRAQARQAGLWRDANFTEPYYCRHFESGHVCYEYDYASQAGRVAALPLIGKSHAVGAPD